MIERLRVRIPARAAGEFSSPGSTLCADSYSVSVPHLVLPQWHVKDPGYSAKCTSGRFHLNTHTPLTHRSRSGLTMPLSRHSVGTYHHFTKKKARREMICRRFSQNPRTRGKSHHHHHHHHHHDSGTKQTVATGAERL